MIANLVPACGHCNTGVKGNTVRGATEAERFIHPYYDEFANGPLWKVEVVPPYEAATFRAVPLETVEAGLIPTLGFHLEHSLGEPFHIEMRNQWGALPRLARRKNIGEVVVTPAMVEQLLVEQLGFCLETEGVNGWRTALYRGVLDDAAAMAFLAASATNVVFG